MSLRDYKKVELLLCGSPVQIPLMAWNINESEFPCMYLQVSLTWFYWSSCSTWQEILEALQGNRRNCSKTEADKKIRKICYTKVNFWCRLWCCAALRVVLEEG